MIIFIKNSIMLKIRALLFVFLFTAVGAYSQKFEEFLDGFESNENGWLEKDDKKQLSKIEDGHFLIKQKIEGACGFGTKIKVNPQYNYEIETSIREVEGTDNNGYGIMFGQFDWEDYFTFVISSNGYAKIYGKVDNEKVVVKDWEKFASIKPMPQSNILRIKQKDDVVRFYINGDLFHSNEKLELVGHKTGFKVDDEMTVEADYIKINRYTEPLNLIENPINGNKLENLGPNINSADEDKSPLITADGKHLYFNRKNDPENIAEDYTDIWVSELDTVNNLWQKAKHLPPPLNNDGYNFVISITPDNNKVLVGNTYKSDGSKGTSGVSISYKKDGRWSLPKEQEVRGFINDDKYVNYFLTNDGTKLLSSIDDGETHGNKDIFISFLNGDSTWTKPMNLGPQVNSYMTDFSPFLAADGKTLFFSSYGHTGYGSSDIFMCTRKDDSWTNWTKPKNLGPEINTDEWDAYFVLASDGDYAYLVSSKEGFGETDIFRIKAPESIKPDPVLIVHGKVIDKKANEPINAYIEYENLKTGERVGIAHSDGWDGFKIVLPAGSNYGFRAEVDGYIPISQNIDLSNLSAFSDTIINLFLVPVEKGQTIALNNIFFDEGKSDLRDESELELRRMIDILMTHNTYKFEIGGHTDNSAADAENKNLSAYRAKTVYTFLIKHGIPENRISFKGYGSKYPIDSNETPIGRQNNRRVEITIK